jgi:hypothetical protein
MGVPAQPIAIEGKTEFSSGLFDPHGDFHAHLKCPTTSAELNLGISRGMTLWQIDTIEVIWAPQPMPTPFATPTPASAAPGKAKRKAKG